MANRKPGTLADIIKQAARLTALSAATDDFERLKAAREAARQLKEGIALESTDRSSDSYVCGAYEMCLRVLERLGDQIVPEPVQELGMRHRRVLRHIYLRPGIRSQDLDSLTQGEFGEPKSPVLDLLYDQGLIEPTRSPGGYRLTPWGEKTLAKNMLTELRDGKLFGEAASVARTPVPPSESTDDMSSKSISRLHQVVDFSDRIEGATRSLFNLDRLAADLCSAIDAVCGFDFAAVQLIRREENMIETIAGSGIAKQWEGHVKHRLEKEKRLRDIQADIAEERKVEIVSGDGDERLDPFIKKFYKHRYLSRVFLPLVVVRDSGGAPIHEARPWEEHEEEGRLVLRLRLERGEEADVVGTVEAGFKPTSEGASIRPRPIALRTARRLAEFASRWAASIHQSTLEGVLERVAEMARGLAEADVVSLQWGTLGADLNVHYWHTVYAGPQTEQMRTARQRAGTIGGVPRVGGIGQRSLRDGQPKFECEGLAESNSELHAQGVRATAVYPSARAQVAGEKICLIYTHYYHSRTMADEELKWVHYLARRSGDLLRTACELADGRDRERALLAMHGVAVSFSNRSNHENVEELLWFIAWSTLNLRGADVISLYQYDARKGRFVTPPVIAGRLREPDRMFTRLNPDDAPMLMLKQTGPLFVAAVCGHGVLDPWGREDGFIAREGIVSTAALRLAVDGELVGLMFVNYRVHHEFSGEEQSQLAALASLSATAVRNYLLTTEKKLVEDSELERLATASLN